MKRANYTPGPWMIDGNGRLTQDGAVLVQSKVDYDPMEILVTSGSGFPGHDDYPYERQLADARLIASAPTMLETLETLRDQFDYAPEAYRLILAAIAKATGGDHE